MAAAGAIRAGRAFIELFADDSKLKQNLHRAQARLKAFARAADELSGKFLRGGLTIAAPLALSTKIFADFTDAISQVRAVTGATAAEFARLEAEAKRLGATTSYTAAQVASLMVELGRAGFLPDQINEMTGAVLNLARATGTDATRSSGIMAATIRQFGLAAEDATRVADVLTVTANKSFNTVETLGESLKYAGPVAADFNLSLEDTLALLGALGNVGIQGSNAGTALRRLLTITGAEAERLKGIFGVEFVDAADNARPLVDVLDEVAQATQDLGTAARSQKFNEAFGLLGITSASAISKSGVAVRALREELDNASGAAARTAEQMDDNLGGSFRMLLSAAEGLAIEIGEALSPNIREVADWLQRFAASAGEWVARNAQVIVTIGGIGAGLLTLAAAFKVAAVAASALHTIFGFMLAHPIVAGLALITAGVGYLSGAFDDATGAAREFAEEMRRVREAGDRARAAHQQMFERLQELADKQQRTNEEQAEAKSIVDELTGAYGDLGLSINEATGEIEGMIGANERLTESMRNRLLGELRAEAASLKLESDTARDDARALGEGSFVRSAGRVLGSFFGMEDAGRAATRLNTEADAADAKRRSILERIAELEAGRGEILDDNLRKQKGATAELRKQARALEDAAASEEQRRRDLTAADRNAQLAELNARANLQGDALADRLLAIRQERDREAARIGGDAGEQGFVQFRTFLENINRNVERQRDREATVADRSAELARLQAQLTLEGAELQRRLQQIEQQRDEELARIGGDKDELAFVRRRGDLASQVLERQLAEATSRVMNARGTFSGTAVARGAFDAGGPADKIVAQLEKLNRKQDELKKAIADNAPKAL